MLSQTSYRNYSDLSKLQTYEERFRYLKLDGAVGLETFGFDRVFNQQFYRSKEWKRIREQIIMRDEGCDLGIRDRVVYGKILIHHMNPISLDDINRQTEILLNPEYLICVSHNTHQAIHYSDENLLVSMPAERSVNDTCPWRH